MTSCKPVISQALVEYHTQSHVMIVNYSITLILEGYIYNLTNIYIIIINHNRSFIPIGFQIHQVRIFQRNKNFHLYIYKYYNWLSPNGLHKQTCLLYVSHPLRGACLSVAAAVHNTSLSSSVHTCKNSK